MKSEIKQRTNTHNVYNILGQYQHNEQLILIQGKATISEEGYIDARLTELPGKRVHDVEGAIMVLEDIMFVDLMECGKKKNESHIAYYLEKYIGTPESAMFEGSYIGKRFDRIKLESDFDKKYDEDKIMTSEEILKMVESIKIESDEGYPAILKLTRIKKI
jgi:hypothetical protein